MSTMPHPIEALLQQRILILDGAMGTMIQRHKLTEAHYRGTEAYGDYTGKRQVFADHPVDLKGNNDLLLLTQPHVIGGIHRQYLEAGADIIETYTFNSNAISLADYGMQHLVYELNVAGAKLARGLCDEFSTADKPRFVAGVLGPTDKTASISPDVNDPGARNITFDELVAKLRRSDARPARRRRGYPDGRNHLRHAQCQGRAVRDRAGLRPARRARADHDFRHHHRCFRAHAVRPDHRSFLQFAGHAKPLSIGLNCALGAELMRHYVEEMSRVANCYVSAHPNAGLPNPLSETGYDEHAGKHRGPDQGIRHQRFPQYRRRLLRHLARASSRPSPRR